jgi:hypothetical protein
VDGGATVGAVLAAGCTLRSDNHHPQHIRPFECLATWKDRQGRTRVSIVRPYTVRRLPRQQFHDQLESKVEGNTVPLCRRYLRTVLLDSAALDEALPARVAARDHSSLRRGALVQQDARSLLVVSSDIYHERHWYPNFIAVRVTTNSNASSEYSIRVVINGTTHLASPFSLETHDVIPLTLQGIVRNADPSLGREVARVACNALFGNTADMGSQDG